MLKKSLVLLIVLALVLSIGLAGCSSKPAADEGKKDEAKKEEPGKTVELSFATGGTAGTYYPLGGAIANVWNENIKGYKVTVQPSGASVENIRLVGSGQADIVMAMNNVAEDAYNGKGEAWKSGPVKNFLAVGVVYPEIMQGIAAKDSGITKIEDLKGKRVALGPPGSGTTVTAEQILKAYGITVDDIEESYGTFGDAVDQMKDGHIDAAWNALAVPAAAITDIATTKDIVVLEIDDEHMEKLMKEFPLVAPYTIPANSYKGQDKPVQTAALQAVLYVNDKLPEDLVYQLVKVMYEKNADIAKGHAAGNQIKLENALNGITTPFHPGAIKYYKEKGMM